MCDYIEKQSTQYQPLPLSVENNVQSQILNRPGGAGGVGGGVGGGGQKKLMPWWELKSCFHRYLPGGLTVFLVKKDCKIKYAFDNSISYADLGLF